jgi:predicted RNA-binding Zn ribbon-like protein
MVDDEDLLLAVLNSAPVANGKTTDLLAGTAGEDFVRRFEGTGSADERARISQVRGHLQAWARGDDDALRHLAPVLDDVALVPHLTGNSIDWVLQTPPDNRIAARAAIAWSRVLEDAPGRLRPCANAECNLFLLDRSRPGTAKWCSMTTCGNRMKSRAHASRLRRAAQL